MDRGNLVEAVGGDGEIVVHLEGVRGTQGKRAKESGNISGGAGPLRLRRQGCSGGGYAVRSFGDTDMKGIGFRATCYLT